MEQEEAGRCFISQKFKHYMKIRFVWQAESSDVEEEWSHIKKCISETAQEVLGQERRKGMKTGTMASVLAWDRRRMKQEREQIETLHKIGNYINKKEKKHIDCTGRRERRLLNKLRKYKMKTIIKSTENSIKVLKNYEQNRNPKYIN
jgi:hypothetical protein